MSLRAVAALVLMLAQPVAAQRVPAATELAGVRARLERLVSSDSTPSIVVAVSRGDSVLWEEGVGWADRERHLPASASVPYAIASVTKTLTATELLRLRDARRVALDRPANEYLGRERVSSPLWNAEQVTVERLATHTAGLPTHYLFCFTGTPNCEVSVRRAIARYAIAIRLPGERFDYSNLGYGVLGEIIGRVTGAGYAAAMQRDVFRPLGMTHSFIGPVSAGVTAAAPYSHAGAREDGYHSTTPAASDGFASADDLLRFGEFQLHEGRVHRTPLADSSVDWMQSHTVRVDAHTRYALGWWIEDDHLGVREVYAQGGTSVAAALLVLVPAERLVIVLLANTGLPLGDLADDVLAALDSTVARATPRADAAASTVPAAPGLTGEWMGAVHTYRGAVPFVLAVNDSGAITGRVGAGSMQPLRRVRYTDDGRVFARLDGALGVDEYRGRQYELAMELALHHDLLTGYVTAYQLPGAVEGVGLSYWVELRRVER